MFDDRMAKLGYDEAVRQLMPLSQRGRRDDDGMTRVKSRSWSDDDGTTTIYRWIGSKRLKQAKNANHIKNCHVSTIAVRAGSQKHMHANF